MSNQRIITSRTHDQRSSHKKSAITRFLSYIKITKASNCWEWAGAKGPNGYGRINFNGKLSLTHRFIYEYFNGPIPTELEIDHLCRNPSCANPEHLEAVSHQENILRGTSFVSINSKKTHCPQGHEYSLDNTYHTPAGKRKCRTCHRDRSRMDRLKLEQRRKMIGEMEFMKKDDW